ncbi:hypothetical protein [Jannaschia rubra]|uniref:Uncharacterized protein n=1 Tax=Jannaschia rubra TaxID=282197 RepID=A0A0M6XNH5_9RHOB|nr:hypothetical protein [Jannaschia rubra]CTQ31665.1 hypothetical protein JAN5088_00423 [Jannaschia rubra]SFG82459.1 hypothetical protein SAMN04488517_11917 [Jannaschia rubra]
MTDERNDLDRLQRETIRQLVAETARLQSRSTPQAMWQAIALAFVCIVLGVAIAVGLTLLGRIL